MDRTTLVGTLVPTEGVPPQHDVASYVGVAQVGPEAGQGLVPHLCPGSAVDQYPVHIVRSGTTEPGTAACSRLFYGSNHMKWYRLNQLECGTRYPQGRYVLRADLTGLIHLSFGPDIEESAGYAGQCRYSGYCTCPPASSP